MYDCIGISVRYTTKNVICFFSLLFLLFLHFLKKQVRLTLFIFIIIIRRSYENRLFEIFDYSIQSLAIRASPCKPQPNLPNQSREILLNVRYIVEGRVLRILTQAIWKNIALLSRYLNFSEGTIVKKAHFL
jgi:hypothetical protein